MDGLELNLFQGNKIVKKRKKLLSKSKKLFIKRRINRSKKATQKFDLSKKKINQPKKEVNQNKDLSTTQKEFDFALDKLQKDDKTETIKKVENKIQSYHTNNFSYLTKSIKDKKKQDKNHIAISIINNEYSDGLTYSKQSSDAKKIKHLNTKNSIQPGRFDSKSSNKNLSDQYSSNVHLDRNELKNNFNELFLSKDKNLCKESNNQLATTTKKYSEKEDKINNKNVFISNLFTNNPEIPEIRLQVLNEENTERVFNDNQSFELFKDIIHPHLISRLSSQLNINIMTNVQLKSIPCILNGDDCLIKSVTGSGKTIAYVVPIIQHLQQKVPRITRTDGIYSLIIVPTRELVMQSFAILENLCRAFTFIVPGYLMGGENKHSEKQRIRKGINILVATPGRLLDHMATTQNLNLKNLEIFVIDEADRMYDTGFEQSIKNILKFIDEQRKKTNHIQTILLSATLSAGVHDLAGLALKNPVMIDTFNESVKKSKYSFPKNLKQYFCLVPAKLRLLTLASFIFKNCSLEKSSKILIFVSTQDIVDFLYCLFSTTLNQVIHKNNFDEIKFFRLHGCIEQKERMNIFQQFKQTQNGVLISTAVSSRGLNLNEIEYVIQYTCPSSIEDYIHSIGRTARIGHDGSSLIFLLPSEINFLKYIQKELEANLIEIRIDDILKVLLLLKFGQLKSKKCFREHASELQFEFESAIYGDEEKKLKLARKAYLSFVRAYATHPKSTKIILPFKELHLGHLCKSFGLRDTPKVLNNFKDETIGKVHRNHSKKIIYDSTHNNKLFNRKMIPKEDEFSEFDSGI